MKGFQRKDRWLSLCGLNCGLCPMQAAGHCGGCGNGNQSCPIAPVQREKAELLEKLLAQYNDGRRKTFCFLAVNLLELPELRAAMARAEGRAAMARPWQRKSRAQRTKGASL